MPQRDRLSYSGVATGDSSRCSPFTERHTGGRTQRKQEGRRRKEAGIVVFAAAAVACVSSPPADRTYSPPPPPHHCHPPHHLDLLSLMTMPGWRRNLTFCLQRMHEEGRTAKQINVRLCLRRHARACVCARGFKFVLKCEQFVSGDTLTLIVSASWV